MPPDATVAMLRRTRPVPKCRQEEAVSVLLAWMSRPREHGDEFRLTVDSAGLLVWTAIRHPGGARHEVGVGRGR